MTPPTIENRSSIRPALPPPDPTSSQWQSPLSIIAFKQSILPTHTPILIIGSGITGTSIAYHFLNQPYPSPPNSILMLEARSACSGATGRNGGHTKHASYRSFLDNMCTHGDAEAARIARFESMTVEDVHLCAKKHGIECERWQGDTVDIFYDEGQRVKAKKAVNEMAKVLGKGDSAARYKLYTAEEAGQKFSVSGALGALSYRAGSLNAYKFTTGLLQICMEKGLNLQTGTPALSIEPNSSNGSSGWTVATARGNISADKVILATNGYTARLLPSLQGIIVPLRGHMTAQRSGSSLPKPSLPRTYSFIYSDGYEYMVPRPATSPFPGDIMIGGGSTKTADSGICEFGTTDDTSTDPTIVDYLKNCTPAYFGKDNWGVDHDEGRLRSAWTGIMGYSADGFPFVGPVPDRTNLFIAASFQGSGMVLSFNCAKALVEMMTGQDEAQRREWFPKVFETSKERWGHEFTGRLHTEVKSMDLEVKAQA